ncbi:MAG: hypothetical protein ACE5GE_10590, partial [Phycisphaerae bacterium]
AATQAPTRRVGSAGFRIAAGLVLLLAGGFVANERIGTTANVDTLDVHRDLLAGFIAVGRSENQPGAIILSRMNREQIKIHAQVSSNWATGKFTRLSVATPTASWNLRLRGPVVVMIDSQGRIASQPVAWTAADFAGLSQAIDCSTVDPDHWKPCGQPFGEMQKWMAGHVGLQLPESARTFIASAQAGD